MPRSKRKIEEAAQSATNPPDTLPENHLITKVIKNQGKDLFVVALPLGKEILVELSKPLRNTFWIKRNGFVVVDTNALADRDNKLQGEICTVILQDKEWRKMKYWPKEFVKSNAYPIDDDDDDDDDGHNDNSDSEVESNVGKLPPSYSDEDV